MNAARRGVSWSAPCLFSLAALLLCLLPAPGAAARGAETDHAAVRIAYELVERLPHDPRIFTQGLLLHDGLLLESSGGYRHSRLLMHRFGEQQTLRELALPRNWFAEGIAVHGDRLYLLTWTTGIAQSYSLPALEPLERYRYEGQGWGLTSDGRHLVQSDGGNTLKWRDPQTFDLLRETRVTLDGEPLAMLNELEWVEGWVVANIWQSDWIVGIDPGSGEVGWSLSLRGLLKQREQRRADVANGIAWDPHKRLLWVTGKLWPWMFALKFDVPPLKRDTAAPIVDN